ncbi:phosphate ABC transporter substrate-binding protein PstS [Paraburkholderia saeva]|uniref:phosphate ABC transporter substrate-binding protein PstS n=1 Tax=Paraburkholderia saeva TaxID=2777537 RepID=UPI001DC698AE|nr:phosphate ABC transporter substrate-binding protein PstS [Paraburkholderia saeva]CAG4901462.1 Phosphate-binding protein PstS [Paraburkholderia saeva]
MRQVQKSAAALLGALLAVAAHATDITGAGSTFAAPIYEKWADAYLKSGGGKVIYQAVGSTEGLKRIIAKEADFAGSDAPLTDEALAKEGLLQFPTVVGGVVPVVNLPDIKPGQLTLSGQVLGDIYLGKITSWNAPAIAALNPGMKLPDMPIAVVRRLDGSGTTLIWTHYLSQVNPEWRSRVGEGATVLWPRGIGGRGNEGMATFVQHVPGAIGYVAWDFTRQNHMAYTAMRNASGAVVQPNPETFGAAANGADWKTSFYQILTNEPGKDAWPVVGATFVLVHTTQDRPDHGRETLKFFDWAMKNGNQAARDLDYISLPDPVVSQIRAQWQSKVKDASGKPVAE